MAKVAKTTGKSVAKNSHKVAAAKKASGHKVLGRTDDGVWLIRPSVKPTVSREKLRSAVARVVDSRG